MKKTLSVLLAAIMALGLLCLNAGAHEGLSLSFDFTNFTSSEDGQTPPAGLSIWNCSAYNGGVYAVKTEYGTSMEMKNNTVKPYLQTIIDPKPILSGSFTLETKIKMNDTNCSRQIGMRQDANNPLITDLLAFTSNGKIKMYGSEIPGMTWQTGTWYELKLSYNVKTRYCEAYISGSGKSIFFSKYISAAAATTMTSAGRIYLINQDAKAESSTYIDDLKLYSTPSLVPTVMKDDFSSYSAANGTTAPTGFKIQNGQAEDESGSKSVVTSAATDRGTSAKYLNNIIGKNLEMVYPISNAELKPTGSFEVDFSMKLSDTNAYRKLLVRDFTGSSDGGNSLTEILGFTANSAYLNGSIIPGLNVNTNVWYDIKLKYNISNGHTWVEIFDGTNTYHHSLVKKIAMNKLDQIHISLGSVGAATETYIDDVSIKHTDALYVSPSVSSFNFNSYEGSDDKLTAPSGFFITNFAAGKTTIGSASDDHGGRCIEMTSDCTTSYELRRNINAYGKYAIKTDIKISDLEPPLRSFGLRGRRDDNSITDIYSFIRFISADKTIEVSAGSPKAYGNAIGTFNLDTWYTVTMLLDTDALTYDVIISGEDGSSYKATSSIPSDCTKIILYEFLANPYTSDDVGKHSATYLDNISYSAIHDFGVVSSAPENRSKGAHPDDGMHITYTNELDKTGISASVDGTPVDPSDISFIGDRTVLISDVFPDNSSCVLSVSATDIYGRTSENTFEIDTANSVFNIGKIVFTKVKDGVPTVINEIESGEITASAEISAAEGYSKDSSFFLALYKNGSLVELKVDYNTISSTSDSASATITVPEDGVYTVNAFLWDSANSPLRYGILN